MTDTPNKFNYVFVFQYQLIALSKSTSKACARLSEKSRLATEHLFPQKDDRYSK